MSPRPPKKRIALLYLKTGGGHSSAARSLQEKIDRLYGDDAETLIFDPIPEGSSFAQRILQDGYRFTSHKIGVIWILLYELSKLKAVDIVWSFFVHLTIRKNLRAFLEGNDIDQVVILHFLLSRPFVWLRRNMSKKPGALRIVTDPFTAHSLWFNCPEIPTIVFSSKLEAHVRKKYPELGRNLYRFPPILGSRFDKASAGERAAGNRVSACTGLREGQKLLLFAGGGEGFPKGKRYISKLLKSGCPHHVVLVCGKDEALRRTAEKLKRRYPGSGFTVFGFVDFMDELMLAADLVVTKGGPATIMEALSCRKPVIVVQYLYGQERGNMEFVKENRFGCYAATPSDMVERIGILTADTGVYAGYQKRIAARPPKNGTEAIARFILEMPG